MKARIDPNSMYTGKTMMNFAVTKELDKDLRRFKLEHKGWRHSQLIQGSIYFVSGLLRYLELDSAEVQEIVAAAKRVHANSANIKMTVPFDYELCKDSIENIKKMLDIPNDYWAIWFAVEFYIKGGWAYAAGRY